MERKVVFHVSNNNQWDRVFPHLINITNEDPEIDIKIVALSSGVDAVLKGYKKESEVIEMTKNYNIEFMICNNTMVGNGIEKEQLIDTVSVVPSGIVKIIDLQNEGYNYIKP